MRVRVALDLVTARTWIEVMRQLQFHFGSSCAETSRLGETTCCDIALLLFRVFEELTAISVAISEYRLLFVFGFVGEFVDYLLCVFIEGEGFASG